MRRVTAEIERTSYTYCDIEVDDVCSDEDIRDAIMDDVHWGADWCVEDETIYGIKIEQLEPDEDYVPIHPDQGKLDI